jgi:proline dehydrogenase
MMRSFFISLSRAAWAQKALLSTPLTRRAAQRFVAGEQADDAIRTVRELNQHNILATMDHLGENTNTLAEATNATSAILDMLDRIKKSAIRANVSLKLSQIGLMIDKDQCIENLTVILEKARNCGNFVRIDMEDSSSTDATLEIYHQFFRAGYLNLGVVIQAYLYRSKNDVLKILAEKGRIRLCKGAYKEGATVAYPVKKDVDANYDRLVDLFLDQIKSNHLVESIPDGFTPARLAVATHDIRRIMHCKQYAESIGLSRQAYEFQMLYGIRRDLQIKLAADGYAVRVYVPYGTQWYSYFMRRLAERPANLKFFITSYFRK